MKIGLDVSSLQGPHRMRGVGYTLINLLNNTSAEAKQKHTFVFYLYTDQESPLDLLDLTGLTYETRPLSHKKSHIRTLPGKLNLILRVISLLDSARESRKGDTRITDSTDLDIFLQTDQMVPLPRGKFKKAFIAYDLIPYVLEWDYLWNYDTARSHGLSRQSSIRCSLRRWNYLQKLAVNTKSSDLIIAISEATRNDFIRYIPHARSKITTIPLGINPPKTFTKDTAPELHRYIPSSWGYLRRPYQHDSVPFILFVGGADKRRKLEELVTAFNHLRARGQKLRLVLAGDTMQGPLSIPTEVTQKALLESSYIDDIVFMGFVMDDQREWLYENALAFVYPSKYEGFGLPVLEAMQYGTPVITYRNSSIIEIADDAALYADGYRSIMTAIELLRKDGHTAKELAKKGPQHAKKFSWVKTSSSVLESLENTLKKAHTS